MKKAFWVLLETVILAVVILVAILLGWQPLWAIITITILTLLLITLAAVFVHTLSNVWPG